MKRDIIFAGVGGQGVVSIAAMLVEAAEVNGFNAKQNEVHGMAQRGGAVLCHVRISDSPIYAGIIPKGGADIICATEPMEALRCVDFLKPDGAIITSLQPFKNIEYPNVEDVIGALKKMGNVTFVDTAALASELGDPRVSNAAILGAVVERLGMFKNAIEASIKRRFASKGEAVVEKNLKAFEKGVGAVH